MQLAQIDHCKIVALDKTAKNISLQKQSGLQFIHIQCYFYNSLEVNIEIQMFNDIEAKSEQPQDYSLCIRYFML